MIYFDAGATTLQKPETVARAMYRAVGQLSSPGRGSYPATRAAEETDLQCRTLAAKLFGVTDPARVVFTSCATHGLNIAVHTLVKPGGRVIISGYEHNAVTRPLHAIPGVEITVADGPLFDGEEMVRQFAAALACPADAVICTHVSNVFGFRLPVERIAALCREKGVPFVLDASQSAGMLPVDMDALGAAFIAMPGHKGLYGPQGTGLLLCGAEPEPLLAGRHGVAVDPAGDAGGAAGPAGGRDAQYAGDRRTVGRAAVCGAAGRGTYCRARETPDAADGGTAAGYSRCGGVLYPGGWGTDRCAELSPGRLGLRGAGRSSCGAGRGGAGGTPLCTSGAPHGGNAGDGHCAVQLFGL